MLKFDIEKTVKYWFDGAEYDMDVAEALYNKGKYPYEETFAYNMSSRDKREVKKIIFEYFEFIENEWDRLQKEERK